MTRADETSKALPGGPSTDAYELDEQVGFILRKANQRHLAIFAARIGDLTPPQFAALAKLYSVGATSQNQLGQLVAMDAATIKGVIDRLKARGLVTLEPHESDRRRLMVSLSPEGQETVEALLPEALEVTEETLMPLTPRETATFLRLLTKLAEG
ncbi:MarR family winged helix-turn-helix transcriptional regulator [Nitratireductor indicus]|uniref:MarR family winged helix-turn-helix transcriptional regulator n=1 Tax=Nitratireductor indicus TaxID=721133 RepID=UPI002875918B|nr:MarR family transcriptional regulator [Nitratireductor indicus]MDS1136359.1 MarR family transcriptional regulator [Nitratireductor indicus]